VSRAPLHSLAIQFKGRPAICRLLGGAPDIGRTVCGRPGRPHGPVSALDYCSPGAFSHVDVAGDDAPGPAARRARCDQIQHR
jgi:hypothetical protein